MKDVKVIEEEIKLFYRYQRQIPLLAESIAEIQSRLDYYGLSSPVIKSAEEAKYQSGTRIYTDAVLLDLFQRRDDAIAELQHMREFCGRVQKVLDQLHPEELEIIELRYKYGYSFRHLARIYYCSKDFAYRRVQELLAKMNAE